MPSLRVTKGQLPKPIRQNAWFILLLFTLSPVFIYMNRVPLNGARECMKKFSSFSAGGIVSTNLSSPYSPSETWDHLKIVENYCLEKTYKPSQDPMDYIRNQTRSLLILDIGGHSGKTTFPPILCFPISHRVITVEPVHSNQNILIQRGKLLGLSHQSNQWNLIRGAFSNITQDSVIYISGSATDNSALSEGSAEVVLKFRKSKEKVHAQPVQVFRGDDIIYNNGLKPDFIKMDTQGAEFMVMQGLRKILSEDRNMVVVAEHAPNLIEKYALGTLDAVILMKSLGFRAYCNPVVKIVNGLFVVPESSSEIIDDKTDGRRYGGCHDFLYWKLGSKNLAIRSKID